MKEREQIKWQFFFFFSFPMRYELAALFKSENWWHDYTPRLPEKYLTGLSWIPLCQTGFYIVLISYEQWGGNRGLCISSDCQRVFFLGPFTLFLSLPPSHVSISKVCVLNKEMYNYQLFPVFSPPELRSLTTGLDQISQFAMETTQKGFS